MSGLPHKKSLSERDICTKFITPNLEAAGWDIQSQVREEVSFTDGRIYVRGRIHARGEKKRADYILYYKPNIPIAVLEAKDNTHSVGAGLQQALGYATPLDVPFVFSSNGDGFVFHDKTAAAGPIETELPLHAFPSPEELWRKYKAFKGISEDIESIVAQDYFQDSTGRSPRYYQQIAINRSIEAIARADGNNRHLLVMATGTGKTYTAFQIIYRLWKSGVKKRILFLADRTSLIDQTARGDFRHFKDAMTIVRKKKVDPAYNIYLSLYQGLSDNNWDDAYKQFSPDFFDLVVVDECHRGSAREDSKWREILEYFGTATHLGLTATPKETKEISSTEYFGDPLYTYSLKQGIEDGFLAPYKVVKVTLDIDTDGWRPPIGFKDKDGKPVEDRIYNRTDFDKNLIVEERRQLVARKITEFLKGSDRFAKTIVFCVDIEHAEAMRRELANANADLIAQNSKYVMQITGDNQEGKRHLDSFINPLETHPVIATTSKLMTTGVDAQTCKLIVLDSNIGSMTEFKQIIGRGTRIHEDQKSITSPSWTSAMSPPFLPMRVSMAIPSGSKKPRKTTISPTPTNRRTTASSKMTSPEIPSFSRSPTLSSSMSFPTTAIKPAARSSSMAWKSPSPRNECNTCPRTARSSPRACATTRDATFCANTPHWTTSCTSGRTPNASAPSSKSWKSAASSLPLCRTKLAPPSIPSTSFATSPTTKNRSPARNAPTKCASAMFSDAMKASHAKSSKVSSTSMPTAAPLIWKIRPSSPLIL